MVWDVLSLCNVGVLKSKEDIRALQVSSDGQLLFSGGKGSQQQGALLTWDLRKGNAPVDECEKTQDIFSLTTKDKYLYLGCRNRQVYPYDIEQACTMNPFHPPHFDAVTSLSILKKTLVSGSRDKNLRCYDYNEPTNEYADTMNAHQDQINTLATDED